MQTTDRIMLFAKTAPAIPANVRSRLKNIKRMMLIGIFFAKIRNDSKNDTKKFFSSVTRITGYKTVTYPKKHIESSVTELSFNILACSPGLNELMRLIICALSFRTPERAALIKLCGIPI